jgi:hypothetical protein
MIATILTILSIDSCEGWDSMNRTAILMAIFTVVGVSGCRSHQLASDNDQFRHKILDMYTDQIMDNLIRAEQGLPMVQMDYTNITGTVTQNGTLGFTSSQTTVDGKVLGLPAVVRTLSHNFTNLASFNPSMYQTNVLTVTANPVLNSNEVYNAYLDFLSKKPSHLVRTCDPPPPGAAHLIRHCGDVYYWIPAEFKYDFLRLSLVTTVQRGQPLTVPDMFENTVVSAPLERSDESGGPVQHRIAVQFGKTMKNGTGTLYAVIRGVQYPMALHMYTPVRDGTPAPGAKMAKAGAGTDWFTLLYKETEIPVKPGVVAFELTHQPNNQPVKVDLDFFKPTVPNTEQLIKAIQSDTQLLRIQGQTH